MFRRNVPILTHKRQTLGKGLPLVGARVLLGCGGLSSRRALALCGG